MVVGNPILIGGGSGGGFTPADEGKVVSNGTLVSQGSQTITQNGTYDTTLIGELIANIAGGGAKNILSGTSAPTSSQGSDGDLYLRDMSLPSDVTFVEYLLSSGTQYIDTGIYATEKTDVTCKFKHLGNNYSVGARTGSWNSMSKTLIVGGDSGNKLVVMKSDVERNGDNFDFSGFSEGTVFTASTKTTEQYNGWTVAISCDGLSIKSILSISSFTSDYSQILFGLNTSSPAYCSAQIYRVTYYENGVPIADYLPCIDVNNVACMWDNIAKEYVYNNGTGTFSYGNVVTPDALENVLYVKNNGMWEVVGNVSEVNTGGSTPTQDDPFALTDYIESSGTQYIDTGYNITSDTEIEIVANINISYDNFPNVFGTRIEYGNNEVSLLWYNHNSSKSLFAWNNRTSAGEIEFDCTPYSNNKTCIVASKKGLRLEREAWWITNGYTNTYESTPVNQYPLFIFGLNDGGSLNSGTLCNMKLYRFRIYEGDTLVHEFIPWIDSNDVVCLKDTVTGNLKYNAGTGDFIYGTD